MVLFDREPYRRVIEAISLLEKTAGDAEPKQILYVINAKASDVLGHPSKKILDRIYNKALYENSTKEVKRVIQSRPDKTRLDNNEITRFNIRDYLNTLLQFGIVEKIERGHYRIAPAFKNEIIRHINKEIIGEYYYKEDLTDYSESNLIIYGLDLIRKLLEATDRIKSRFPDEYIFSIDVDTECEEDLNKGNIPQDFMDKFNSFFVIEMNRSLHELKEDLEGDLPESPRIRQPLSDRAVISKGKTNEWIIDDEGRKYVIRKEDRELKVYNSPKLSEYGTNHITNIENRINEIIEQIEELNKEVDEAYDYINNFNIAYTEECIDYAKKHNWYPMVWNYVHPNFTLFYSRFLHTSPQSVELAAAVSRWHRVRMDESLSREEKEKIAKELWEKYGIKMLRALRFVNVTLDFTDYIKDESSFTRLYKK